MNPRIANLVKALNAYPEAAQLIRLATVSGLKTIGLDDTGSRLINSLVGDRWDFVVAKWILSEAIYNGETYQTMSPRFSSFKDDIAQSLKALMIITKLESMPSDGRKAYYDYDIQCRFLDGWLDANKLPDSAMFDGEDLSEDTLVWLRRDSNRTAEEVIDSYKTAIVNSVTQSVQKFIASDFMIDTLSDKWISPSQAKKLSRSEALERWSEWKGPKFDTILRMEDGWRWVDAGTNHSEWVRTNLKNCGTASWGGLRAKDTSKNMMFILMDDNNKPHGLTTYNASYVDIWAPDEPPKRYIGYPEGLASEPLKSKYYPYFLKLVDFLNPDEINLPHAGVYNSSGKVADNEDLRKLLEPDKLRK
jgi:hypothetical protein